MVVDCPNCSTKFKLDDSKITAKGVKVRCSKCKHIFNVTSSGIQAVEPPPQSLPAADLTISPVSPPPPPPPKAKAPPPPKPPPSDFDFEQDTFDFKDETPAPKTVLPAGPPQTGLNDDMDFSFDDKPAGSSPKDAPIGLGDISLDNDKTVPAKPSPASPPRSEPQADDDFGDFDFDDEPPPPKAQPAPAPPPPKDVKPAPPPPPKNVQPAPPPKKAEAQIDDFDFDDFSDSSKDTAPAGKPGAKQSKDDFGDEFGADDFNFDTGPPSGPGAGAKDDIQEFGDISLDDAKAPDSGKKSPASDAKSDIGDEFEMDIGGTETTPPPKEKKKPEKTAAPPKPAGGGGDAYAFNAESSDISDSDMPVSGKDDTPPPDERPGAPRKRGEKRVEQSKKKIPVAKVLVILIVLGLLGGAGYKIKTSDKLKNIKGINLDTIKILVGLKKPDRPHNIFEVAQIKAGDFHKVTRKDGKVIWVLKGTLINYYDVSQWKILLEATAKDGEKIRTGQAMAGNVIPNDQLESAPIDQIRRLTMSTMDENLMNKIFLSEQAIDYMIIFTDIVGQKPELSGEKPVAVKEHEAL